MARAFGAQVAHQRGFHDGECADALAGGGEPFAAGVSIQHGAGARGAEHAAQALQPRGAGAELQGVPFGAQRASAKPANTRRP